MTRIEQAFLKQSKAFIGFITAGDPDLESTKELILAMEKAGADIIEVGIPFSDPVAEGEVIQRANQRALEAGCTTDKIFAMLADVRKISQVPLVFLTYVNPIYIYGGQKFFAKCKAIGIDGVIVPDVPFEEKANLQKYCSEYQVDLISLIAPTSKARIQSIAKEAKGYIYVVSSLGVTGVRQTITTDVQTIVKEIRKCTATPVAVGFGISTCVQAKTMAAVSDGAIVGSAIIKLVEQYGKDAVSPVTAYVKAMAEAVHTADLERK